MQGEERGGEGKNKQRENGAKREGEERKRREGEKGKGEERKGGEGEAAVPSGPTLQQVLSSCSAEGKVSTTTWLHCYCFE